jgi:hypothetical protein
MKKISLAWMIAMWAIAASIVIVLAVFFLDTDSCLQRQIQRHERRGFVAKPAFFNCTDIFYSNEVTAYPASAQVLARNSSLERLGLGISISPDSMTFGAVPEGENYVTRKIDLENLKDGTREVLLVSFGNITPYVKFSPSEVELGPGQKATVDIRFYAANASAGNYSGEIDIFARVPMNNLLATLGVYGIADTFFGAPETQAGAGLAK